MIDEQTSRAYELSARADMLAQRGELEQARALMSEAARLDGTYSVRAELLGVADPRPVKVASSVRKLLRPFLLEAGFQCNPLGLANGDLFTHLIAFAPGSIFTPAPPVGQPLIFIAHGTRDQVLPIDLTSRRMVPRLRGAGYSVTYREFDGVHAVPKPIAREALEWLTR